jgi:hypothetical protein
LATAVERERRLTVDPNPYAVPSVAECQDTVTFADDLTEAGARQAKAVVSDANLVPVIIIVSIFFGLLGLVLLPWYAYRIRTWKRLNAEFSELRVPNGLSVHGELAESFQECIPKLWIGLIAGAAFWIFAVAGISYLVIVNKLRST